MENSSILETFQSDAYQLLKKIGEGGFGQVYLARQNNTGQSVAIKFLSISSEFDAAKKQRYIDRFSRETLLSSRLQHPNIVRLLDKGQYGEALLYAVFEYVDGVSLKEYLAEHGAFTAVESANIMAQILDGLTHAHEQGVIHRDIKPANIMLSTVGAKMHAKVLDFGIGTLVNEARQLDYKSITLTQETLGTPSYSAPEQLRGEPPTIKTDIYVWALVFIECLTGRAAVSGANLASIFHKQLSQSNVPLPAAIVGHPLATLLRRALQKKVHERTVTAAELFHELNKINISSLVGDFDDQKEISQSVEQTSMLASFEQETQIQEGILSLTGLTERKQLTVLAVCLKVRNVSAELVDPEVIDALFRDQKSQTIDTAIRYGAFHVGTLADTSLFYFGYPSVSDNDARLSARAALDIISTLTKRNSILEDTQGIHVDAYIGLHTGIVTTYADATPEGDTPNIALELSRLADANQILASDFSRKILSAYIEFESALPQKLGVNTQHIATSNLVAERQVEAFGFLRGTRKSHAFVGREQEMAFLTKLLASVTNQVDDSNAVTNNNQVHIFGEAGIGKSRLVFELRDQAPDYDHYVAQCLPEHINNALYPILTVLKYKWSLDSLKPDQAADLFVDLAQRHPNLLEPSYYQALPILFTWLNIPLIKDMEPSALTPELQKQLLFKVLTDLFLIDTIGRNAANLYIFEDMHWADPTSLEFIAEFTHHIQHSRHVFVSTSRKALPEKLAQQAVNLLPINKLSTRSTKDFILALFDQEAVSTNILDALISRTDGIPLFVEELVNMLKQKAFIHKINGVIDFINPDKLDEVPTSLRDSLQQKLDSLVYAKETAQLAATIGREFNYDLLVAASCHSESQVQNDINELVEAELIYQQRKVTGDSYIFKHALVRDAAYESMPASHNEKLHLSIAMALTLRFENIVNLEPLSVADHFAKAKSFIEAFKYGIRAISKLAKNSFYKEAMQLSDIIDNWKVEIIEGNKEFGAECTLKLNNLIIPISTMLNGWAYTGLKEIAEENLELLNHGQLNDYLTLSENDIIDIRYKSEWTLFYYHHYSGQRKIARSLGEELLTKTRLKKDRVKELIVRTTLGQAYFFDGDFDIAISSLNYVIEHYDVKKDINLSTEFGFDPYYFSAGNLMSLAALKGNFDEAIKYRTLCLEHAITTKNIPTILTAYTWGTCYFFLTFDIEGMKDWCEKALESHGDNFKSDWIVKYFNMNYDWTKRDFEQAAITVVAEIESGQDGILSWYDPLLADTYSYLNMHEDSVNLIKQSIERTLNNGDNCILPILYRVLGNILYRSTNQLCKEAHDAYLKAIAEAKYRKSYWLEFISLYELIDKIEHVSMRSELLERAKYLYLKMKDTNNTNPWLVKFRQEHIEKLF